MQKILFLCGTHGDEGHLIHLFDTLNPIWKPYYDVLLVNEEACKKNVRYVNYDMNRNAPGDIQSNDYELKRCAEIIEKAKTYDLVIDLHATHSHCGSFVIITLGSKENILASMQYCADIPKVIREGSHKES
jgi:succinylglutamate desuccinylase